MSEQILCKFYGKLQVDSLNVQRVLCVGHVMGKMFSTSFWWEPYTYLLLRSDAIHDSIGSYPEKIRSSYILKTSEGRGTARECVVIQGDAFANNG